MIRGLFTGASGMSAQQVRLDAISNNLANVDTDGFKRDVAVHKAFAELLLRRTNDDGVTLNPFGSGDLAPIGKIGTGVENNELYTEFEQGALKQTENDFDLADGRQGLLRRPDSLRRALHPLRRLRARQGRPPGDEEGYPVLGESGPLQIKANNFKVDKDGNVYVNKQLPGRSLPARLPRGEHLGRPREARHAEDRGISEGPIHRQSRGTASGGPPRNRATPPSSRRDRGRRSPKASSRRAT